MGTAGHLTPALDDTNPSAPSKPADATRGSAKNNQLFSSAASAQAGVDTRTVQKIRKAPGASHVPPAHRKQMQQLLATADLNTQQIQMQRLEHKLLSDQLEKLAGDRTASPSPAAGGAMAAVRQAAA